MQKLSKDKRMLLIRVGKGMETQKGKQQMHTKPPKKDMRRK